MFFESAIMVAVFATGVSRAAPVATCDLAEVNHVVACDGGCKFTQLIAWDWMPDVGRFHCQGWRIVTKHWMTKKGVTAEVGENQQVVLLHAPITRETWTTRDPERDDRDVFPEKFRRKVW